MLYLTASRQGATRVIFVHAQTGHAVAGPLCLSVDLLAWDMSSSGSITCMGIWMRAFSLLKSLEVR